MSNELTIGIDKPSFYKAHQNFVEVQWNVYETDSPINSSFSQFINVDAYGSDAYGDYFETNVLLNAGWNRVIYNFNYQEIIDGYGKAHGLTAEEVIDLFFDGYAFDGYNFEIFVSRSPCDNGCLDTTFKLSMEASLYSFLKLWDIDLAFIVIHSCVLWNGKTLTIVFLVLHIHDRWRLFYMGVHSHHNMFCCHVLFCIPDSLP